MCQFGVLLADGKPGPFVFQMQYLKAVLQFREGDLISLPGSTRPPPVLLDEDPDAGKGLMQQLSAS